MEGGWVGSLVGGGRGIWRQRECGLPSSWGGAGRGGMGRGGTPGFSDLGGIR